MTRQRVHDVPSDAVYFGHWRDARGVVTPEYVMPVHVVHAERVAAGEFARRTREERRRGFFYTREI